MPQSAGRDGSGSQIDARPVAAALLGLTGVLAVGHALRLLAVAGLEGVPTLLVGLVCGALLADAVTGVVHWGCDTWGSERTPWLGRALIQGFRDHHRNPLGMLAHDRVTVNAEPGVAAGAGLALLALPPVQRVLVVRPFAYATLLALIVLSGAANQLHQWAHAPRPPRWVRALQRCGVVLSRRGHAVHHGPTHSRAYCIATGWLNPFLDRLGVWRGLERGIEAVTRVPPRREDAALREPAGPRAGARTGRRRRAAGGAR